MILGALDTLRMDFGRGLGALDAAHTFLGKGAADVFDPAGIFHDPNAEAKEKAKAEAAAEKAKQERIAALVFCPKGQKPNPDYVNVPIEARAQAAAAGIQQCVPDEGAEGGVDKGCFFQAGDRKYPCDQDGMDRAAAHARSLAVKGGKPRFVVQFAKGKVVKLARCIVPVPKAGAGAPVPAFPGAAMPIPATAALTPAPPGLFNCPAPAKAAYNAQGQVVCVNPATLAAQTAAASTPTAIKRSTKGKSRGGSKGSKRNRGGLRGFAFGDTPAVPMVDASLRGRIKLLQILLRRLRVMDAKGQPVKVTGMLDGATLEAVNNYQMAAGRLPPGAASLTTGEVLVGLDTLLGRLRDDLGAMSGLGCMGPDAPAGSRGMGCGADMRGLGDFSTSVMQANARYGGPRIPSAQFTQGIPGAKWMGRPVVQPRLSNQGCPKGYFPTQRGCVAYSTFASGDGFPRASVRTDIMQPLRAFDLAPSIPSWMQNQLVPPGGSQPGFTLW